MREEFKAQCDAPWPFPDDLCKECFGEWFKTPEARVQMEPVARAFEAKFRKDLERWEQRVRSTALKVLDFADELVGKL